jgi:hypothetical protein
MTGEGRTHCRISQGLSFSLFYLLEPEMSWITVYGAWSSLVRFGSRTRTPLCDKAV